MIMDLRKRVRGGRSNKFKKKKELIFKLFL